MVDITMVSKILVSLFIKEKCLERISKFHSSIEDEELKEKYIKDLLSIQNKNCIN